MVIARRSSGEWEGRLRENVATEQKKTALTK